MECRKHDVRDHVGSERLRDEIIAADSGSVLQNAVQDMAENPFVIRIF